MLQSSTAAFASCQTYRQTCGVPPSHRRTSRSAPANGCSPSPACVKPRDRPREPRRRRVVMAGLGGGGARHRHVSEPLMYEPLPLCFNAFKWSGESSRTAGPISRTGGGGSISSSVLVDRMRTREMKLKMYQEYPHHHHQCELIHTRTYTSLFSSLL